MKHPVKFHIIYGILSCLALLPMGMLYAMVAPVRFILRRVIKYRRKMIRKNLANSFPDYDEERIREIEKEYYRHLCDMMAETIKLIKISDKELSKRLIVTNPEIVDSILESGTPVVLLLGHIANWEYVPHLTTYSRCDVPFGEIYRPLHDKAWGEIYNRMRGRWDNVIQVPQKSAVKDILRWNAKGPWIVGFLADQRPYGRNIDHWFEFLNQETAVTVGPEQIGRHTNARFVYADVAETRRGYYTITYKEITAAPDGEEEYPVTRQYLSLLEQTIKRAPALWLWSHNRWKQKKQ